MIDTIIIIVLIIMIIITFNKSIKVSYLKLVELLELKKDDLNISYKKATTRQLQLIQHLLLKTKDLNIIKCNVYVGGQIIL